MRLSIVILAAFALLASGCAGARRGELWADLGDLNRPVTTRSAEAQELFDQGLTWVYAFNHDEAIRSFQAATRIDPDCAMAWWGIAFANGPHINNPEMDAEQIAEAYAAMRRAEELAPSARPVEAALIRAISKRYAKDGGNREKLNQDFADAMREVWRQFPDDVDVATLYADSLMNLQPWDLWTHDGQPKKAATEIVAILEDVLKKDPNHAGANHLYIHAVEASPFPERANAAAERLRNWAPLAGHLVHMPSHIDVQTGRWAMAADQNAKAIAADERYRRVAEPPRFYTVYMLHNRHFLSFASMMEGRSKVAVDAARGMIASIPAEILAGKPALIDPYMAIPYEALMRFGRWDEVLAEPAPDSRLVITTCMWHFARGVAYAAKGDVAAAEAEHQRFNEARKRVPAGAMMAINPAEKVLDIADLMLRGETEFRRGEIDKAVASLTKAIEIEDSLRYMEPPDWVQPVRHTLGAVLTSAGRWAEAEKVYEADLQVWPENGWSLHGLAVCLKKRGAPEAAAVQARFEKAWARADVNIDSSCLCIPGHACAADTAEAVAAK
ncbi:MAG: hypothetical protein AMXMBFR47_19290 [Planctomycetota bacterium]